MSTQLLAAGMFALFMCGLFVMVASLVVIKEDPLSMYKLFRVRDELIRLVVTGQIERNDPHFDAIYRNVNALLRSGHVLCGPSGWMEAERQGQLFAHEPHLAARLRTLPKGKPPEAMVPIVQELRPALRYMSQNHFGIFTQVVSKLREQNRIQKEQAKKFLDMMPPDQLAHA
jgi:hypothetical protein